MWLCLNEAFLSIVAPQREACDTVNLIVRARRPGDIERIFPHHSAVTIDGRDYQFRAIIPRTEVAEAIASCITGITYTNFKNSVKNNGLHDAYLGFWHLMAKVQPQRPYSNYSRPPVQRQHGLPFRAQPASAAPKVTTVMRQWCDRLSRPACFTLKRRVNGLAVSATGTSGYVAPNAPMVEKLEMAGLIEFKAAGDGVFEVAYLTEVGKQAAEKA
jgi:hypothetical protein